MLQREVADRLAAAPGTTEYGVLSHAHAAATPTSRSLLALPPGAFRPAPKVRSAVVRLTLPARRRSDPQRRSRSTRLVRSVFTQRRKTLANALKPFSAPAGVGPAAALAAAGLDGRRRPETLQLAELAAACGRFRCGLSAPACAIVSPVFSLTARPRPSQRPGAERRPVPAGALAVVFDVAFTGRWCRPDGGHLPRVDGAIAAWDPTYRDRR